jgi:hypothetical protein
MFPGTRFKVRNFINLVPMGLSVTYLSRHPVGHFPKKCPVTRFTNAISHCESCPQKPYRFHSFSKSLMHPGMPHATCYSHKSICMLKYNYLAGRKIVLHFELYSIKLPCGSFTYFSQLQCKLSSVCRSLDCASKKEQWDRRTNYIQWLFHKSAV